MFVCIPDTLMTMLTHASHRQSTSCIDNAFRGHSPAILEPSLSPACSPAGELFFAGYRLNNQPYVVYSGLDTEGQVMFDCPVTIPDPIMMHDLQITADYAIIMDTCVEFKPKVSCCLLCCFWAILR